MKAELITHSGDDLMVVNAARVSFDKESGMEFVIPEGGLHPKSVIIKKLYDKDKKLIKYLATHNHYTPFAHPQITLRETVPIFVARQRFKHVVGFTYNEVSRRYVDDSPEFYVPEVWRRRAVNKKQGSSDETVAIDPAEIAHFYRDIHYIYNALLKRNVCPEQARMVLPQSMFTSYYVTGSLAAFARAYKLRAQPDAQEEIQVLAKEWDRIIRPLFPISWGALVDPK